MKFTQEQIDKIHRISDWSIKGILFVGFVIIFLKPGNWFWWVSGISLLLAIIFNAISAHWATDEEKEEFKRAVKEAVQEAQKEEKKKAKAAYNGESPLIDLEPKQIAVVHKILCDIPSQGNHIKTAELKHILHVLEERGDIDMSNREQVLAWVEAITKRRVESNKFWNEYDWRRSTDREKYWSKKIVTEFDNLR